LEPTQQTAARPEKHSFLLFVSGMSVKSSLAIENLRKICDRYFSDNFELQIIDIANEQQMAVDHQIIGIPTLIKTGPEPRRVVVGDLSDTPKVLKILNIS
jgi:circadian clock protein KaiB